MISVHMSHAYMLILPPLPLPGLMYLSLSSFYIIPFSISANISFLPLTEKALIGCTFSLTVHQQTAPFTVMA